MSFVNCQRFMLSSPEDRMDYISGIGLQFRSRGTDPTGVTLHGSCDGGQPLGSLILDMLNVPFVIWFSLLLFTSLIGGIILYRFGTGLDSLFSWIVSSICRWRLHISVLALLLSILLSFSPIFGFALPRL